MDNTQTRLSDEVVKPSLLEIIGDRELNATIQKHCSLEEVEIEIKISQQGKELFIARRLRFNSCPCNPVQHSVPCFHSVDSNNNPIC